MHDEDFYLAVRESCHTLNNKLIAIQGFCGLMVQDEMDETIEASLKQIREIAVDISHMTRKISTCIKQQSTEKGVKTTIIDTMSKLKNAISTLRTAVDELLQQAPTNGDKSTSYAKKVLIAMQQAEETIVHISR